MFSRFRVIFIMSLVLFLPVSVYVRKRQLRETLWREAKGWMGIA